MNEPRKEIMAFAWAMEQKMSEHDKSRGSSWRDMKEDWLLSRALEELGEFLRSKEEDELTDAANFLMMAWSLRTDEDK